MLTVLFTEREMRELLELNQSDFQDKTDELEEQLDKQKEGLQLTISSLEMQLAEANTQLAEAPAAGPAAIDGYPAYFKNIAIPAPSLDNVVEDVMKVRLPKLRHCHWDLLCESMTVSLSAQTRVLALAYLIMSVVFSQLIVLVRI